MKYIKSLIILFVICFSVTVPKTGSSIDFNVGLYGYLAYWVPAWRSLFSDFKSEPLLLLGPFLSVNFLDKFNISMLYIRASVYRPRASYNINSTGSQGPYTISMDTEVVRQDFDVTAGYKFTEYLKGYLGVKYFTYNEGDWDDSSKGTATVTSPYTVFDGIYTNKARALGPSIGVSYLFPLGEFLFLSLNSSILYLKLLMRLPRWSELYGPTDLYHDENYQHEYNGFGYNLTANLSYYFSEINTSILLGGRFQIMKYFKKRDDSPELYNDYFYGVNLAAILHF